MWCPPNSQLIIAARSYEALMTARTQAHGSIYLQEIWDCLPCALHADAPALTQPFRASPRTRRTDQALTLPTTMSFFTSSAYASFHQHIPLKTEGHQPENHVVALPTSPTSGDTCAAAMNWKLSPQKSAAANKNSYNNAFTGDRAHDNSSFVSTSSSASTASEYDPLSPAHSTRAADPWPDVSFSGMTPTTSAAASLKVYDQIDDGEEWGEFLNSSCIAGHAQELHDDVSGSAIQSTPELNLRGTRRANKAAVNKREYDGWQRIPQAHFERVSSSDDVDGDHEKLNDPAYRATHSSPHNQQHSRKDFDVQRTGSTASSNRQERNSGVFDSIASAVKTRLASFRSESKSPLLASASWSTRLYSGDDDITTTPARGYDSYDITFERGPIGLELETDWYGRQAVVKGFKAMRDGQDGLARQCGVIRIGDVLTAIDGASCLEMSFQETLSKLRVVSTRRHVLHFKSLEAAGDLSVYTRDMAILQAKRFIHEHKETFYRPPRPVVSSESVPLGHRGLLLGSVERFRGASVTAFHFHREDTGAFVLACSCVNDGTGVFVFHTLQDSHLRAFDALPRSEDSAVYLGQMVPNFFGTAFTVLDHQQQRRNELGYLVYSANVLGRVPNFLTCVFPRQPTAQMADDDRDDANDEPEGDRSASEAPNRTTQQQQQQQQSRPRAATAPTSSSALQRHEREDTTMDDRNGSLADRYARVQQQRNVSLVDRLRALSCSLDDLETRLDAAASDVVDAHWRDADGVDVCGHAMRLAPSDSRRITSSSSSSCNVRTTSMRRLATMPYGAVEQTEYASDLLTFETKKPVWHDELGAWTLNFHGRVKMASKKNFLLVPAAVRDGAMAHTCRDDDFVALRFGKVTPTRFALDFRAPLSPLLALAVVCSSFAHKLAVT